MIKASAFVINLSHNSFVWPLCIYPNGYDGCDFVVGVVESRVRVLMPLKTCRVERLVTWLTRVCGSWKRGWWLRCRLRHLAVAQKCEVRRQ
ncbi:hypothetical protein TNCV_877341 [Trichonephila clavipes]|nr:hypothetical protein TNCV_877341 [Trichonephila clavipes]